MDGLAERNRFGNTVMCRISGLDRMIPMSLRSNEFIVSLNRLSSFAVTCDSISAISDVIGCKERSCSIIMKMVDSFVKSFITSLESEYSA